MALNNLIARLGEDLVAKALQERNFSGLDLNGVDWSGTDWSGFDFNGTNLNNADLSGACLSNANFRGARLHNANLSEADLNGANLSSADLDTANLSGADLNDANLSGANLRAANFSRADLIRADLSRCQLQNAFFGQADMAGANLDRSDCLAANFSQARMGGVRLRYANLKRATLYRAELTGAILDRTDLTSADLRKAKLRHATIIEVELWGAILPSGQTANPKTALAELLEFSFEKQDKGLATLPAIQPGSDLYDFAKESQRNFQPSQPSPNTPYQQRLNLPTPSEPSSLVPSEAKALYNPSLRDPTEQQIRVLERRYGRWAVHLAAHAAFPLTLTTDLVYCLRETFLPKCPWYVAADVLLSNVCMSVGYDLYEMETATRRYLLRYLRDQFGEGRFLEVERFMIAYLRHRLTVEDSDRPLILGEKPQWTSLACLRPGEAREQIQQTLQELASKTLDPKERFRLAALVESYGDFLADRGFEPLMLEWADRVAEGEPIDETADLTAKLVEAGFHVRSIEFDVATVTFGEPTPPSAPDEALQVFEFDTVTLDDDGNAIRTEARQAFYFSEPLAEGVPPLEMVAIPSGEFMMGSPEDEPERYDDEGPQHRVTVAPFFISQTPINQSQWRAVAQLPQQERELDPDPSSFKGAQRPVEQVSWEEAIEFCQRLSEHTGRTYRLPTEAEWEYACRADTTTPYAFGNTITKQVVHYSADSTIGVGQMPFNGFGLQDMHGNVWEWCLDDWHDNYEGAPTDGSAWLTEENRDRTFSDHSSSSKVLRGGSWDYNPRDCRSACRLNNYLDNRDIVFGFRVICEARGL